MGREPLGLDRDRLAERILGQVLFSHRERCWLAGFCADERHLELAAWFLRCLYRLSALYMVEWGEQLLYQTPTWSDVEIRDASVQLVVA